MPLVQIADDHEPNRGDVAHSSSVHHSALVTNHADALRRHRVAYDAPGAWVAARRMPGAFERCAPPDAAA